MEEVHYVAFLLNPRSKVLMRKHARVAPQRPDGLPVANLNVLWHQCRDKMPVYLRKFFSQNPMAYAEASAEWVHYEQDSGLFAGATYDLQTDQSPQAWWRGTRSCWLKHVPWLHWLGF